MTNEEFKQYNGMVRLMIKDNGEGIPEERLLEIKERSDFKKDSCGFGISYNNDILHYYYGENFKFEIESHPGEGTCVIMEIPVEISDRRLLE